MTGLPMIPGDQDVVFWLVIKEHLTPHELQRYMSLKSILSDAGRGRSWLRSTLNEHSLERYFHMLLGNLQSLSQYYEPWSFLLDEERSSMLPTMARGLGSILFAINIDNEELNGTKVGLPSLTSLIQSSDVVEAANLNEPDAESSAPLASSPIVLKEGKKKKKKKKPAVSIVSFNDGQHSSQVISGSSVPQPRLDTMNTNSFDSTSSSSDFVSKSVPGDEAMNFHGLIPGSDVDVNMADNSSKVSKHFDSHSTNIETGPVQYPTDASTQPDHLVRMERKSSNPIEIVQHNGSYGSYATSFPAKTPPSTPYDSTTLSEYSNSRKTLSVEAVSDQLQIQRDLNPEGEDIQTECQHSSEGDKEGLLDHQSLSKTTSESSIDREGSPFHSKSSFHVIGDDGEVPIYPLSQDSVLNQEDSQSNDSSSLAFSTEVENAALGVALAQKGFTDGLLEAKLTEDPEKYSAMSHDELRQAMMTVMSKNDELEGKIRSLRTLLDSEMEHSALVRGQLEESQKGVQEREEEYKEEIQSLSRENELLKNQLKKYVGAVQMLRRDGPSAVEGLPGLRLEDAQPPIPERKAPSIDSSELAEKYEEKLIQVAEMHGELMEFNEYLTTNLKAKEFFIARLKEELVELRGPLPMDNPDSDPNSPDSDIVSLSPANRALINLWIPSAFLRGKNKDGFHVYQVYVRIRDEEWNIYRRYSEFRELHLRMRKAYPIVNTFDFPPKKTVGNKDAKFVESRRKKLQHYLRCIINFALSNFSKLSENPSKESLITLLPFFGDAARRKRSSQTQSQQQLLRSGRRPGNPTYEASSNALF
ncbi:sorting nexin-29-like isoform X4 [Apostichopus japonicus]